MPAVSTMLPAGYGRKVRAEWTIAPDTPGSVTNIFPIADIGRGDEWGQFSWRSECIFGAKRLVGFGRHENFFYAKHYIWRTTAHGTRQFG